MSADSGNSLVSGALPTAVASYLAASDRDDIEAIVGCFTDDAAVLDEDRYWKGAAAIREWREGVAAAFEYTSTVTGSRTLSEVDGAQRLDVYTHLEGNFPGGQVDLTNRFTLRGEQIIGLEIVPTAATS